MGVTEVRRGTDDLPALLPVAGLLGLVGLDAADVVRGALHQGLHQVVGLLLQSGNRQQREQHGDTENHTAAAPCLRGLSVRGDREV